MTRISIHETMKVVGWKKKYVTIKRKKKIYSYSMLLVINTKKKEKKKKSCCNCLFLKFKFAR